MVKIKNRVAASLANPRFRPKKVRDKKKVIPRKQKHKEIGQ